MASDRYRTVLAARVRELDLRHTHGVAHTRACHRGIEALTPQHLGHARSPYALGYCACIPAETAATLTYLAERADPQARFTQLGATLGPLVARQALLGPASWFRALDARSCCEQATETDLEAAMHADLHDLHAALAVPGPAQVTLVVHQPSFPANTDPGREAQADLAFHGPARSTTDLIAFALPEAPARRYADALTRTAILPLQATDEATWAVLARLTTRERLDVPAHRLPAVLTDLFHAASAVLA